MKKHTFEIFLKIYLKIFYEYIFYILIAAIIDIYIYTCIWNMSDMWKPHITANVVAFTISWVIAHINNGWMTNVPYN